MCDRGGMEVDGWVGGLAGVGLMKGIIDSGQEMGGNGRSAPGTLKFGN